MTKDEVITKLKRHGLITQIGDTYHLTSRANISIGKNLYDYAKDEVLATKLETYPSHSAYPTSMRGLTGNLLLLTMYEELNIPSYKSTEKGRYSLRSQTKSATMAFQSIFNSEAYDGKLVMACIKDYYSLVSMPKSFTNFMEYEFEPLYATYAKGETIKKRDKPSNETWG